MQLLIIIATCVLSLIQDSEQLPYKTDDKLRTRRSIITTVERARWPNKEIHFAFATNSPSRVSGVEIVMAEYEEKTCLKFKKVPRSNPSYKVVIRDDLPGCYTFIGYRRNDREKELSLGETCDNLSTIRHELQHVMGVLHMQSAYDRDKYVKFYSKNVVSQDEASNFAKVPRTQADYFGGQYDFRSNMHYSSNLKAKPGTEALVALKRSDHTMIDHRNNPRLSFFDLMAINNAYKCGEKCNNKRCNGYLDKNCNCITPQDPMFGGSLNNPKWPPKRAPGTGATLDVGVISRVMSGVDSVVRVRSGLPSQPFLPVGGKSFPDCQNTAKVYYERKSDQFLVHLNSNKPSAGCFVDIQCLDHNTVQTDGILKTAVHDLHGRVWMLLYMPSFKPKVVLEEPV